MPFTFSWNVGAIQGGARNIEILKYLEILKMSIMHFLRTLHEMSAHLSARTSNFECPHVI